MAWTLIDEVGRAELLLDWVEERFDDIVARVAPIRVPGIAHVVRGCDPELVARAERFFNDRDAPGLMTELGRVEDSVRGCYDLRQREGASARAAIEAMVVSGATSSRDD